MNKKAKSFLIVTLILQIVITVLLLYFLANPEKNIVIVVCCSLSISLIINTIIFLLVNVKKDSENIF